MKRLLTTLSQKWPEYLLEILVLVIGIYGAFELENWNESAKNNQKREAICRSLKAEFESNLKDLNIAMKVHTKSAESGKEFLRLIAGDEKLSPESGDSLMKAFFNAWTYNPRNGALRTGISSGDIHLLEDDTLLELLFEWEDVVNDAVEDERYGVNHLLHFLDNANDHLEWQNILVIDGAEWIGSSNYDLLLKDPIFKYFVTVQVVFHQSAFQELNELKRSNEKILELLQTP